MLIKHELNESNVHERDFSGNISNKIKTQSEMKSYISGIFIGLNLYNPDEKESHRSDLKPHKMMEEFFSKVVDSEDDYLNIRLFNHIVEIFFISNEKENFGELLIASGKRYREHGDETIELIKNGGYPIGEKDMDNYFSQKLQWKKDILMIIENLVIIYSLPLISRQAFESFFLLPENYFVMGSMSFERVLEFYGTYQALIVNSLNDESNLYNSYCKSLRSDRIEKLKVGEKGNISTGLSLNANYLVTIANSFSNYFQPIHVIRVLKKFDDEERNSISNIFNVRGAKLMFLDFLAYLCLESGVDFKEFVYKCYLGSDLSLSWNSLSTKGNSELIEFYVKIVRFFENYDEGLPLTWQWELIGIST